MTTRRTFLLATLPAAALATVAARASRQPAGQCQWLVFGMGQEGVRRRAAMNYAQRVLP
jgi:hypothetical protein